MPQDHWGVTVDRSGNEIVRIEPRCLTGREPDDMDRQAIRTAAHALLGFIGDPMPATGRDWTFEDHGDGVVYVKAPSGRKAALGYLIGSAWNDRDHLLRELVIDLLRTASIKKEIG